MSDSLFQTKPLFLRGQEYRPRGSVHFFCLLRASDDIDDDGDGTVTHSQHADDATVTDYEHADDAALTDHEHGNYATLHMV